MKSDIFLALSVALLAFYLSFGNNGRWYHDALTVEVVPPYLAAYFALQDKIIDPLLTVTVEELENEATGSAAMTDLVRFLTCGVKVMRDNITRADWKSQGIGKKLENEVAALLLSIGQTEGDIATTQNAVASLATQVSHTEGQVRSAEQAVNDRQNSVNQANQQVAEAQRAVDKARDCRGKRFIRRVVRRVVNAVCSVVNSGGIDRAKSRRSLAERELNDARGRLASLQQQLNNLRGARDNLQNQLASSNSRLQSLRTQLNSLQEQQKVTSALMDHLRRLSLQISTVVASSIVLQDTIEKLTDFENLIIPLNAVYNEMNRNGLITGNDATVVSSLITADNAAKVRQNLGLLKTKLARMPLNSNAPEAC